jgi:hypothetical protein
VQPIPGGGWTSSVQGSCDFNDGLKTISVSPDHSSVGYDSDTGTIIVYVFPPPSINPYCAWPPSEPPKTVLPASIQNGMAVSSGNAIRPCQIDANTISCSDTISWDVFVPLQAEVCPQGAAPITQSVSHQNVEVQQVANCPPTVGAVLKR